MLRNSTTSELEQSERGGELEDMSIDEKGGLDHRGICGA